MLGWYNFWEFLSIAKQSLEFLSGDIEAVQLNLK